MNTEREKRNREFIDGSIQKYQQADSPAGRKKVNAMVTMAFRGKLISSEDKDRFNREKGKKVLT